MLASRETSCSCKAVSLPYKTPWPQLQSSSQTRPSSTEGRSRNAAGREESPRGALQSYVSIRENRSVPEFVQALSMRISGPADLYVG